ncbi:hypothetical protein [Rhodoplanes azumiensis]|uniref:Uncharacterized protein n=1 Tax=Rhodoplanes azumiensis TaxID=1897628 RepID=A0ABW5ANA6_9BRAD
MADPVRTEESIRRDMRLRALLRQPLFRLLAINLAIGLVVAVIAVAGLLALDAHRLRSLILGDQSPVVAVGLLLFGFAITLGSWVMGSAIMRLGDDDDDDTGRSAAAPVTDTAEPLPVRIGARARRR